MPLEDKSKRLSVMREIAKYNMDTSLLNIRVINQVCYMDGRISRNRGPGAITNLQKAMSEVEDAVRSMHGINDVVIEVALD